MCWSKLSPHYLVVVCICLAKSLNTKQLVALLAVSNLNATASYLSRLLQATAITNPRFERVHCSEPLPSCSSQVAYVSVCCYHASVSKKRLLRTNWPTDTVRLRLNIDSGAVQSLLAAETRATRKNGEPLFDLPFIFNSQGHRFSPRVALLRLLQGICCSDTLLLITLPR